MYTQYYRPPASRQRGRGIGRVIGRLALKTGMKMVKRFTVNRSQSGEVADFQDF